jgi:predicted SAM-dependent methyltransferase
MPTLLNLGCGQRFCADASWTNVDFNAADGRVIVHDLRRRLPFEDGRFDAVYHSHLLEHFTLKDGRQLIGECRRVLKPGGVLRVAVPDGAQICRLYLDALARLETGERDWQGKYDWMVLELYDQAVRTATGGEMANYLRRTEVPDEDFIIARIGNVGREILASTRERAGEGGTASAPRSALWRRWAGRIKRAPGRLRRQLKLALLNDREREALALGLFRLSGEVHQWMYDGHSLRRLLEGAGFLDVQRCAAAESRIEGWASYHLDVGVDGAEHAPSSVYMEGRKPVAESAR